MYSNITYSCMLKFILLLKYETGSNKYLTTSKFSLRIRSPLNKKIICIYTVLSLPTQSMLLINKRKFGLFKTTNFLDKKLKYKLITLANLIKFDNIDNKKFDTKKKPKIIFYKKLNKFFYRDGRSILMKKLNIKKYLIQKFTTKKIYNLIKKPMLTCNLNNTISNNLVQCSLFYTVNDAINFIKHFGINIDGIWGNDPNYRINSIKFFSIANSYDLLKFLKKKKNKILHNFKKIKFYKYRSKLYLPKKNFIWLPNNKWLHEYSFLYTNKLSNIEFDLKTMHGILLYDSNYLNYMTSYESSNISLFMNRSYTWKYLT